MTPNLSVVSRDQKPETVAQRVRRLQQEARTAARDHMAELSEAIAEVERIAAEIAEGGDAYPVGVRNLARLTVGDCASRAETLGGILARAK